MRTLDSAFKTFPRAARSLFFLGANAKVVEADGTTTLHLMAKIGNRSAAEVLLEHGADINARTTGGTTPLDIAKKHRHLRMVHFLQNRSVAADQPRKPMQELPAETGLSKGRTHARIAWYRADRGIGYLRDPSGYGDLFFDADSISGSAPIGICGLVNRDGLDGIDLGFALLPQYRSNGYAFEFASAMISHAASAHGIRKLLAITKPNNDVSGRLLERLGFRFERLVRIKEDGDEDKLYAVDLGSTCESQRTAS